MPAGIPSDNVKFQAQYLRFSPPHESAIQIECPFILINGNRAQQIATLGSFFN